MQNISMSDYQKADGLSNHALQQFVKDPASYIWSKTAPRDTQKTATTDIGTALHCAILEPEKYDDIVLIADVKGRETIAFKKQQDENQDKIILTELENTKIKFMAASTTCHPVFNDLIKTDGACETSIFVDDPETGLKLKIRPDKILMLGDEIELGDIKTTANLEDWQSTVKWKNPLFTFGYGFTAAFYLYVASIYFKREITTYNFLAVQTTVSCGSYPVSVYQITKQELIDFGFWSEMIDALHSFKACKESNNFNIKQSFPNFGDNDGVEIKFEE